jgi:plasmid replication initiation protein
MNKNLIVKEPEELVLMKGDFSESALKLSAYLIASLKKDEVNYKIKVKDYLEKFDKKIGNYDYLHNVAKELTKKQFEIEDRFNKTFEIYNFVASAKYKDSVLEIEFSRKLLVYLLEIKEKYLKYNIKNIMSLNSKYSIRLYKILKDKLEQETRYNKKAVLEIFIDDLRELLSIPKSYKFGNIKEQILEKTKQEFMEFTDIIFEYEGIKTGRKMTHLKFYIYSKNNKKPKIIQENKKEILEIKKSKKELQFENNNWNDWRKELLKNGNVIVLLEDKIFKLKNGYLFENNKLLSSEKSFEIWQNLYENRDKLQIKTKDEYLQEQIKEAKEQENKYIKLKKIIEKFDAKNILAQVNKDTPMTEYTIIAIQFGDDDIELHLEENYSKERSITLFNDINILENFLEKSRQNYLQNKENENSKIKVNNNKLLKIVEKLKNKYINTQLLIQIDENEEMECKVITIQVYDNIELHLKFKDEEEIVVESFDLNNNDIDRLKKFLERYSEAYLKRKKGNINKNLQNKISSLLKNI